MSVRAAARRRMVDEERMVVLENGSGSLLGDGDGDSGRM